MTSNAVLQPDPQPIVACTISRDVQVFDLLIEDMEAAVGEGWGDLTFSDAVAFLEQPDADQLQFLAIAIDESDEADLSLIIDIITVAKAKDIKVILIAEDISPAALHQLLSQGADEFVPYPLPENELSKVIEQVLKEEPPEQVATQTNHTMKATGDRNGVVLPIHGLAGGTGATTLAVNLAWELATIDKTDPPRVCLLDFDLQFGSASTYLDLPRREAVFELLSDTESMDKESFLQALLTYGDRLYVLTAPAEMVPLDVVTPDDITRLIDAARTNFDYVVIDMPSAMVEWYETVLQAAHVYFATLEMDMRSAQNTVRLKRALQGEELPFEKIRFILNRAPKFTDLSGKSRVKRMAESLGISIEIQLPDGGKPVAQNADQGVTMAEGLGKSALRKEVQKLAQSIHDVNQSEVAGG